MHQLKNKREQRTQENPPIPRLVRINSVIKLTGLSKSYVYDLCKRGVFPRSIQLVPGGTSVAWLESEIQEWIESRVQQRNEAFKPVHPHSGVSDCLK